MNASGIRCTLALLMSALCSAAYAGSGPSLPDVGKVVSGPNMSIPLINWSPDSQSFIANSKSLVREKAANTATIFRPLAVCRLLDTRVGATDAWIEPNAPFLANPRHTIDAAGLCGIPSGGVVAGISLAFSVYNYTVNNGGYISFLTV